MKKIIDLVSSRIFVFILAVLLQMVWLMLLAWGMTNLATPATWLVESLSLIFVLWIVNKKINPAYKLAWTILILAFPVFGVVVYVLFGQSRFAGAMTKESSAVLHEIKNYFKESHTVRKEASSHIPYHHRSDGHPRLLLLFLPESPESDSTFCLHE